MCVGWIKQSLLLTPYFMKETYKRNEVITLIVIAVVIALAIARSHMPKSAPVAPPASSQNDTTHVYQNSMMGFSLRLPSIASSEGADGYKVDESYKYQALGPGKDIFGTKFTIPKLLSAGTNLSSDSYISVEEIPKASNCSASLFVAPGSAVEKITDNGISYSVATTSDAGAGNRYDETVYAIPGTNPCVAVRYFIHYSAFENYPAGSIKQFDEQALIASFDQIRMTLVINQ